MDSLSGGGSIRALILQLTELFEDGQPLFNSFVLRSCAY